jgi:hypothetical protein
VHALLSVTRIFYYVGNNVWNGEQKPIFFTEIVDGEPVKHATVPDFMWAGKKRVAYLDGDIVHRNSQEWDEKVRTDLEKRKWKVCLSLALLSWRWLRSWLSITRLRKRRACGE